ncbi:MAG: transposase [Elusimicrobia bacterium]|nr:transposase [Elusimicrobiota bacterium]
MPRQARLDAPGLLHHVIARGLERRVIFPQKSDFEDFLTRVEISLEKSPNQLLAWALMPNHFHFLIRTGSGGLSRFMRRLMSGYAVAFNARHKRSGYLFQNRYKSIVCQEDPYFTELVRYIHLNPVRAGMVKTLSDLDQYPYCGHSALMGKVSRPWQATGPVLERFGSLQRYRRFMEEGKNQGRRPELLGGGLLRSRGGLSAVIEARREGDRQQGDPRVLGEGDFVAQVLQKAENKLEAQNTIRREGKDLRTMALAVAKKAGIPERALFSRGRRAEVSRAKSAFIYLGVEYFGRTVKGLGAATRMTPAAASKARERGEQLLNENPEWRSLFN